ncbi:hypothetical protein WDU94_004700 [Cyamophila willieti]
MVRPRTYELGLILLLVQILHLGADTIPPVTLGLVLVHTLLYMDIIRKPWRPIDVCISAETVWQEKDWKRIFLSAFEHGDDMHLYYNMVSLILKGRHLERMFGQLKFLVLVVFLTIFTSMYYVGISYGMSIVNNDPTELSHCAIGFSAVLFAMKTILTRHNPDSYQHILNVEVKGTYAPWFELFIIHLLVPNASFKGHLSGILVGLTYTDTPIGWALDYFVDKFDKGPHDSKEDAEEKDVGA